MRYTIIFPGLCLALVALGACSSESGDDQSDSGHVWQGQVEAIDKAREVETILKRKQEQEQQQ